MRVEINTTLSAGTCTTVLIPKVKSWKDIKSWYVKWDVFNYTLDNKKWLVAALGSDSTETVDYKRPISVRVYDPKTNDLLEEQEQ